MYPSYAVSCNHGYGRHWDHHDDDMQVRRLPDRCRKPRNHISPVVKCLLFSFNFLFWVGTWWRHDIETVSAEGTFCDTVQVPSGGGDMQLI